MTVWPVMTVMPEQKAVEPGGRDIDTVGTGNEIDEDVVAGAGGGGGLADAGGKAHQPDGRPGDARARRIENAPGEFAGDLGGDGKN